MLASLRAQLARVEAAKCVEARVQATLSTTVAVLRVTEEYRGKGEEERAKLGGGFPGGDADLVDELFRRSGCGHHTFSLSHTQAHTRVRGFVRVLAQAPCVNVVIVCSRRRGKRKMFSGFGGRA